MSYIQVYSIVSKMRTYELAYRGANIIQYYHDPLKQSEFEKMVRAVRNRYENLLATLGKVGTEVSRTRILDQDPDLAPHDFVRSATHDFVLPKQIDGLAEAKKTEAQKTNIGDRGHPIFKDVIRRDILEMVIEGRLRLTYNDTSIPPQMKLEDMTGNSESFLEPAEIEAIESAFAGNLAEES